MERRHSTRRTSRTIFLETSPATFNLPPRRPNTGCSGTPRVLTPESRASVSRVIKTVMRSAEPPHVSFSQMKTHSERLHAMVTGEPYTAPAAARPLWQAITGVATASAASPLWPASSNEMK